MLRSPQPGEPASVVAPTPATPAPPPVAVVDDVPPTTPSTAMGDDDIALAGSENRDESNNDNFTPVDYAELVHRAVAKEEAEMNELRRKAEGAGVVRIAEPYKWQTLEGIWPELCPKTWGRVKIASRRERKHGRKWFARIQRMLCASVV